MKKLFFFLLAISGILVYGIAIHSCQKVTNRDTIEISPPVGYVEGTGNPFIYPFEKLPEATVKLLPLNTSCFRESCSYLIPDLIEASLEAGESVTEEKTGVICNSIEKGDVIFMFDLTGSMKQELNNVKVNSMNIMVAIREVMSDADFGVVSHMDYDGIYSACGYTDHYGTISNGDYPYKLNHSVTSDMNTIVDSINKLKIGFGWDYPESYSRVLFELSSPDAGIGWREGSKKIVVAWLDNQPHDCGLGTGPDPGRDAIAENSDDIAIDDAIQGLIDNNIVLFALFSGKLNPLEDHLALWESYCEQTSGGAFQINEDGTIPGGIDIDEYIAQIIEEEVSPIDEVTLQVCTSGFESWLSSVTPENYTNVEIIDSIALPFNIEITVPEGTENGVYEFDICLIGDGVEFGRQHVKINVVSPTEVPFDIHPTSCPNPINRSRCSVIPAAICGFDSLDVHDIDVSSLNIQGVFPIRFAYEDVVTPYYPFIGKEMDKMSCTTDGPDGYEDLTIKFNNLQISELLRDYNKNDIVKLTIKGKLENGTPIIGEDIIIIVK
jgi:hypothetical protein